MTEADPGSARRPRFALPPLLYLRPLPDVPAAEGPRFSIADPYVERCWLAVLGPSATWCLRRFGVELDAHPDGTVVELAALARGLGVGEDLGPRSTLARTLERLVDFRLARFGEADTLEVRTALPPLGARALARLSPEGQTAHRQLVAAASRELEGAREHRANLLLVAALDYAAHELPVLPLRPRDKAPHGLLVPHGLRDATTDPERIAEWWRRVPNANVGIRTGPSITGPSDHSRGLDVIDLDSEAATRAFAERAPEPVTPGLLVKTARGWHLWFAASGLPSRAALMQEIDVRGEGGYVVAPPSLHPSGATYHLVDPATGVILDRLPDAALPPAPTWLAAWCRPEPARSRPVREGNARSPIRLSAEHYVHVAVSAECEAVATTPEGARNHRLNRAAFSLGTLVGAKVLDADEARTHLLDAALRAGLSEREAERTITSGLGAGERQPRQRTSRAERTAPAERVASAERGRTTPVEHSADEHGAERGRSPDPSRRPADADATVLARARHDAPVTRRPISPPRPPAPVPRRELGR